MARTWTWYCVCGCAQEVPEEGTYASEECEESPEVPFPPLTDRSPEEACERGTVGCPISHRTGEESCETW